MESTGNAPKQALPEIFRPHEGKREPNVLSDALLDEIPNPEAAEEEEDESDEPE